MAAGGERRDLEFGPCDHSYLGDIDDFLEAGSVALQKFELFAASADD